MRCSRAVFGLELFTPGLPADTSQRGCLLQMNRVNRRLTFRAVAFQALRDRLGLFAPG